MADLVGLAITRELGAVMTGVIMSGRTGAAFAAQIGSMRVNEEIDALTTFGISPTQFLVLPRVLALIIMMPLLCVVRTLYPCWRDGCRDWDLRGEHATVYSPDRLRSIAYGPWNRGLQEYLFGIIIAIAGCYRGLNCGKDATAVGLATTSAVVTSITWIVIADAIFAVGFQMLGI